MAGIQQPQRPQRRVQFAISTLVVGVLAVGAMLGLQMRTNWSFGESFCGTLMFLMAVFLIANFLNWVLRRRAKEEPAIIPSRQASNDPPK